MRDKAPVPSVTSPRLVMALEDRPSVTFPLLVLKDSVPAEIAPEPDWVIAAWLPVVAMLTEPVVVNASVNDSDVELERDSAPDPNDTTPRLLMVLDAVASDTAPFCVLNDSVPAVIIPESLCVIGAPAPVVVSDTVLLPAFTSLFTARVPLVVTVTPPAALMPPAKIRLPLFSRLKPPDPSVTLSSVVMEFSAVDSETLELLV